LFSGIADTLHPAYVLSVFDGFGLSLKAVALDILFSAGVLAFECFAGDGGIASFVVGMPSHIRWLFYWAIVLMIFALNESTASQFVYFQF
jgi:hypothetical protein